MADHLTYPAPWNTIVTALGLTVYWAAVSLIFLGSRSLAAAIAFNNVMAVVGFAQNGLDLPGTAVVGWLLAALALASFALLFALTRQWPWASRSSHGG